MRMESRGSCGQFTAEIPASGKRMKKIRIRERSLLRVNENMKVYSAEQDDFTNTIDHLKNSVMDV